MQSQNKKNGFILLELLLGLLISVLFAVFVFRGFGQMLSSWDNLSTKTNLHDVSHYIISIMEKNITYDSSLVTIARDSKSIDTLVCQTVHGNMLYTFSCENERIYKAIQKASTVGKNPLYVSDCKVDSWHISKINDHLLGIELSLSQKQYNIKVTRYIYCMNGRIN